MSQGKHDSNNGIGLHATYHAECNATYWWNNKYYACIVIVRCDGRISILLFMSRVSIIGAIHFWNRLWTAKPVHQPSVHVHRNIHKLLFAFYLGLTKQPGASSVWFEPGADPSWANPGRVCGCVQLLLKNTKFCIRADDRMRVLNSNCLHLKRLASWSAHWCVHMLLEDYYVFAGIF